MKQTKFTVVAILLEYDDGIPDLMQHSDFNKSVNDLLAKGWQVINSGQHDCPKGVVVWVHLVKTE